MCTVKTHVQLQQTTLIAICSQLRDMCLALCLYCFVFFTTNKNITSLKLGDSCYLFKPLTAIICRQLTVSSSSKIIFEPSNQLYLTETEQHLPLLPQSAQEMSSSGLLSRFCSLVPRQKLQMGMGSATGWQTAEHEGKGDTRQGNKSVNHLNSLIVQM